MKIWRSIIVDDESLARAELNDQLKEFPQIQVIGEASDIDQAYDLVITLLPDLVFLDIDLGVNTGFNLLEKVDTGFKVIFVTAHDEYAIRAFEVNALDYILKPVWPDRLAICLDRLGNPYSGKLRENLDFHDQILVKIRSGSKFIKVSEISCIEACSDYTRIYSTKRFSGLVHHTLKRWVDRLPRGLFFRIHKSYIINSSFVKEIKTDKDNSHYAIVMFPEKPIPVSRRYGGQLFSALKP